MKRRRKNTKRAMKMRKRMPPESLKKKVIKISCTKDLSRNG